MSFSTSACFPPRHICGNDFILNVTLNRGHHPAYPEVTTVTVGKSGCAGKMNLQLPLDATISRVAVEVAGENLAVVVRYSHGDSSRLDEDGEAVTDLLVIDWDTFKAKLDIVR